MSEQLSVEARMDQMEERLYRIARRGPSDVKGLAWATLRDLAALRGDWVIALAGAVLAGIEVDEEPPAGEEPIDGPLPEATCARCSAECSREAQRSEAGRVAPAGSVLGPTTITDVIRRAEPVLQDEHAGV